MGSLDKFKISLENRQAINNKAYTLKFKIRGK